AIAGLLPLASGQLSLNCVTLDDGKRWLPPEQRNIGMIFQDYALFPHLTVAQNVGFGLDAMPAKQKQAKIAEMLALVHLDAFAERYPH
ncbi:ATP-binding cassette domain-containing protein, partial [Salmonella enterica]